MSVFLPWNMVHPQKILGGPAMVILRYLRL